MTRHVVGLTGRKRSGKDTFAARLIEKHGFTRVSLADPLRDLALAIDPWVVLEADELGLLYGPAQGLNAVFRVSTVRLAYIVESIGWERAKEIREVRRLLQVIGTNGVRDVIGDRTWIELAERTIASIPGNVVVTDVRFPNEAEVVEHVVRIMRPTLAPSFDLHPSETAMDGYLVDHQVTNDGTVEELHAQADHFAYLLS